MARNLENQTNVDAPSADYPSGRIRNDNGSGNGTPVTEKVYGDYHQFFSKIMRDTGVVPNDLPDNETNGFQLNEALRKYPAISNFATLSVPPVDVDKWIEIYELDIDNIPFGNIRLSFDIYSIGSDSAIVRNGRIDAHMVVDDVPPYSNFSVNGSFSTTTDELFGFNEEDLKAVLVTDSSTQKTIKIFARFRHDFESIVCSSQYIDGNGTVTELLTGVPLASLPAGTEFDIGWIGLPATAGVATIHDPVAVLRNGRHVKFRGLVDVGAILATFTLPDSSYALPFVGVGGPTGNLCTTEQDDIVKLDTVPAAGGTLNIRVIVETTAVYPKGVNLSALNYWLP